MTIPWTKSNDRSNEWKAPLLLVVFCSLLMAGGLAMTSSKSARTTLPPIALGDVADAQLVEIRDRGGRVVLAGEFRSHVDNVGNTEKDASLTDRHGRTVIGEVEIEIPVATRLNRRPELEVDILGLAARETFTVVIDDRVVASFITDDRGSVDMELQEGEIPGLASNPCPPFDDATALPASQR